MEVGISTASFYPDYLTEETVPCMAELGIHTAEIFLETASEYEEDYCIRLREALDHHSIRAYSIHVLSTQYEPQLFSLTERQRRDARVIMEKALKAGEILGAEVYVFHGPSVRKNTVPNIKYSTAARITDELAEVTRQYGLKLSWENVYWCWFDDPSFATHLLEYSRSDNLYFTLDIKQAMKSQEQDPFKFLQAMGNRVANVHLCDFDNQGNLLFPGKGSFPFAALKQGLEAINYTGPVITEVYRNNYSQYQDMHQGLQFLREVFETSSQLK